MGTSSTATKPTTFQDARRRDWTVVITGETICEATRAGIDIDLGAVAKAASSGNPLDLVSLKFLGQMIDLCWFGCRHNSRLVAGKISESDFKAAISGKALMPAIMATVFAICECFGMEVVEVAEGEVPADGNPTEAPKE